MPNPRGTHIAHGRVPGRWLRWFVTATLRGMATSSLRRTRYDAVIIGSGHNGLVAAAYLGRAGRSVLVLERNADLGGATTSKRIFPDYDAWLSRYSYLVSLFPQRIIDELGLTFTTRRRETASFTPYTDGAGRHRGLVVSNVDAQRSRDSLKELTGRDDDWHSWQRLAALQSTLAKIAWPSLLDPLKHRREFRAMLTNENERRAWSAFVERPLGEILEATTTNDILRGLLMTDGKIGVFTHPHDESLLQNRCFLYHVIGNETGEWRVPVGGMKSLVDGLVTICRAAGVELFTTALATHISLGRDTHAVTFDLDGRTTTVDATHVLINAGPRTQARLLNEPWSPEPGNEGSVIKMNMLLTRLPRLKATGVTSAEAFAGSFHVDEGYEQMQRSFVAASAGQLPEPLPFEMYCHTLTDDSILSSELRARGFHTLTLFGLDVPHRLFAVDHDQHRDLVRERYLDALDQLCAESFHDCLARDQSGRPCVEIHTPQDLERELDLDQGNIFHNAPSWFFTDDDQEVGQWGVETRHPRIMIAGSSALRGGAVSGIPGRNAAMSVLEQALT